MCFNCYNRNVVAAPPPPSQAPEDRTEKKKMHVHSGMPCEQLCAVSECGELPLATMEGSRCCKCYANNIFVVEQTQNALAAPPPTSPDDKEKDKREVARAHSSTKLDAPVAPSQLKSKMSQMSYETLPRDCVGMLLDDALKCMAEETEREKPKEREEAAVLVALPPVPTVPANQSPDPVPLQVASPAPVSKQEAEPAPPDAAGCSPLGVETSGGAMASLPPSLSHSSPSQLAVRDDTMPPSMPLSALMHLSACVPVPETGHDDITGPQGTEKQKNGQRETSVAPVSSQVPAAAPEEVEEELQLQRVTARFRVSLEGLAARYGFGLHIGLGTDAPVHIYVHIYRCVLVWLWVGVTTTRPPRHSNFEALTLLPDSSRPSIQF
jgi:hypothetical protein